MTRARRIARMAALLGCLLLAAVVLVHLVMKCVALGEAATGWFLPQLIAGGILVSGLPLLGIAGFWWLSLPLIWSRAIVATLLALLMIAAPLGYARYKYLETLEAMTVEVLV